MLKTVLTLMLAQIFLGGLASAEPQEESKWTLEVTANRNWVSGPGAAQSYLATDRFFIGSDFSYRYNKTDEDKKFNFAFHGRSTDDPRIDRQTWSLTSLEMGWADAKSTFSAGDVMADFSPYSMSGSLKGLSYNVRTGTGQIGEVGQREYSFIYGVGYPRWDNFWGGYDVKAIRRAVQGFNVKQNVSEKATVGLSMVKSKDSGRIASWDELYENSVYSLNWDYRPQDGITLKGETARSYTKRSPSLTDPDENYQGCATNISLNADARHQKWLFEFQRVSPKFTSLLGYAITDQQMTKLRWTKNVSPDVSINAGVGYTHDKLDDTSTKSFRTSMYQPELSFTFNSPFRRDNAILDLGLRLDRRFGGGSSTADRSITAAYRDTFGKVDADLSMDYQFYDTAPYAAGIRNKNLAFNITLATSDNRGEYILRPTLNIGLSRSMDMLNHYDDRMFETSLGFGYQRPADNLSINWKFGVNQNLKQVTPDSSRWFTNFRIDAQPKYLKMLNQNATQYLEININSYKFDDKGNNFRETSLVSGVRVEF